MTSRLVVLHVPSVESVPLLDVVVIPTFTSLSSSLLGPNDVWIEKLVVELPNCRIITFHINSPASPWRNGVANAHRWFWQDFLDLGNTLLFELLALRGAQAVKQPILFLCSSFGSFPVKQCLWRSAQEEGLQDVSQHCRGIVFLGCLHDQDHGDFESNLRECARIEMEVSARFKNTEPTILSALGDDNIIASFKVLCARFNEVCSSWRTVSFTELKPTKINSKLHVLDKTHRLLVHQNLNRLNSAGHRILPLECDHTTLVRFPTDSTGAHILREARTFLTQTNGSSIPSEEAEPTLETSAKVTENPMPPAMDVQDTYINVNRDPMHTTEVPTNSLNEAFRSRHNFSQISTSSATLPCYMIKAYRDPNFVGRGEVLDRLKESLDPQVGSQQPIFLLHGLGGMGKTQTAIRFAMTNRNRYRAILFARADEPSKVAWDFADFAKELALVGDFGKDLEAPREALKQWFANTTEPWLLILDNVESLESLDFLESYLPEGPQGCILLTSRRKELLGPVAHQAEKLEPLDAESAAQLFHTLSGTKQHKDTEAINHIVNRVDRLPLGVLAAASVIRNGSLTPSEFLEAYSNGDLLRESSRPGISRHSRYHLNLATAWDWEFQQLSPGAQFLLNVCAFMDARSISEDLFFAGASKCSDSDIGLFASKKEFHQCRAELCRTSLVSRDESLRQISMHRLVEENCHFRMSEQECGLACRSATHLLHAILPVQKRHQQHETAVWKKVRPILSHVVALCGCVERALEEVRRRSRPHGVALLTPHNDPDLPQLLYNSAWYLYEQGVFETAIKMCNVAKVFSVDRSVLLSDIHYLRGTCHMECNRIEAAIKDQVMAREKFVKACEQNDVKLPDIREPSTVGIIGHTYQCKGEYVDAERSYKEAIGYWHRHDFPGRPVIWQLGLALSLIPQGKLVEAESVLDSILEYRTGLFGPFDTKSTITCSALNIKGNIRNVQARYDEAFNLHTHALQLFKQSFGTTHHRTADVCYKVAWHLHRRGELAESRLMLQQALKIYRVSPSYRGEVARCLFKLSQVARKAGEVSEANSHLQEAEDIYAQISGSNVRPPASDADFDRLIVFWSR